MTTKDKRFPLKLSSVVEQRVNAGKQVYQTTVLPQTAMKNSVQNISLRSGMATNNLSGKKNALLAGGSPPNIVNSVVDRSHGNAVVSDAVRKAMVSRVKAQGVLDELVLAALQAVPRHLFIDPGLANQAYVDASLPIGHHQTISQPYIVARMLEILRNGAKLNKVLEIGTGCGYQAAVLSLIAKEVYSIERIKALHELAKNNLRPMRIANIRLQYGDGMLGLPQAAPFDGIILAAAGLEVPDVLLEQLQIGGRLIAPVGGKAQVLKLIERISIGEWTSVILEQCHFVPLRAGIG
ncbi:MAG: protein-L-isoaspartate(D-aspartate) O-methyltransferase [Burkholderiales bacterium]|nr:protein-L-isoaspartate(D-aspartate) O-methyltransferase [Burkholderiales bacterium]